MSKPDRKRVESASRIRIDLYVDVPEGMEERGEDFLIDTIKNLSAADNDEVLASFIRHDHGEVGEIPEYMWEEWEENQRAERASSDPEVGKRILLRRRSPETGRVFLGEYVIREATNDGRYVKLRSNTSARVEWLDWDTVNSVIEHEFPTDNE